MRTKTLLWPSPRSAYIHVPFCRHRCGYCNFSVVAERDDLIQRFLEAIDRELATTTAKGCDVPVLDTMFVGGGTPTHLPLDSLERFLENLRRRFRLADGFEWTMEANPEDLTQEKLDVLSRFGVNRISLGVQSFNDRKLATLERSHSGANAQSIIERVARAIPNVSIDLIFGAPGESVSHWERDLRTAVTLPVKHVSTYALTFEKGTAFWTRRRRGSLSMVDETDELAMYDLGRQVLADGELEHYEISNFAKSGFRCRHNLAYWRGEGWYAAGPGAAAFVDGNRVVNHRSTTAYLKRIENGLSPIAESDRLSAETAAREFAAFGVRMIDGVDLAQTRHSLGVCVETLCAIELDRLQSQGFIERSDHHIKLTSRGIHFADTVASELLG